LFQNGVSHLVFHSKYGDLKDQNLWPFANRTLRFSPNNNEWPSFFTN